MDLKAYEHLIRTESAARKFMLGFCWKNQQRFCPKCRQRKLYRLTDGRRRCSRCGYTFHDFSGRWINLVDLDCGQWLRLIKLFELELSSRKIAQQLSVSYKVAHRAVMVLRGAIMAHAPDAQKLLGGEVEIDESYFGGKRKGKRGRGASGKVPVFGILERDGLVHVEAVPNVRAETLLGMTIKKVRRGKLRLHGQVQGLRFPYVLRIQAPQGGSRQKGLCQRQSLHQRPGRLLELCQGTPYQAPWCFKDLVPLLPERTRVPVQ